MLRIHFTFKVTSLEVLRRLNTETKIVYTVKRRKLKYFFYVMRINKYELPQVLVKDEINGNCERGRARIIWMDNLKKWFKLDVI